MPSASPRLRSALLLHVITGPLWSGKSRRLIEVIEAQRAAYERVLVVQHAARLLDHREGITVRVAGWKGFGVQRFDAIDFVDHT